MTVNHGVLGSSPRGGALKKPLNISLRAFLFLGGCGYLVVNDQTVKAEKNLQLKFHPMLLAIIFPWLSFLIRGHMLRGILCLILQMTILGWIPAALWACFKLTDDRNGKKIRLLEKQISEQNKILRKDY